MGVPVVLLAALGYGGRGDGNYGDYGGYGGYGDYGNDVFYRTIISRGFL